MDLFRSMFPAFMTVAAAVAAVGQTGVAADQTGVAADQTGVAADQTGVAADPVTGAAAHIPAYQPLRQPTSLAERPVHWPVTLLKGEAQKVSRPGSCLTLRSYHFSQDSNGPTFQRYDICQPVATFSLKDAQDSGKPH